MTTYKQTVPETIWVTYAGYLELLNSPVIDPFAGHYTGNLIHALETVAGECEMEYARRTR